MIKKLFLVGFALMLEGACGKDKVPSLGNDGSGGASAVDAGDGGLNPDADDSRDQPEADAVDQDVAAPGTGDDALDDSPASSADAAMDHSDGLSELETTTIEPCPGTDPPLAVACSAYCSRVTVVCPGQFADFDACANACTAPTWSCGKPGDATGNTLYCRITHATAATKSSAAAAVECPQAAPDSTTCR